MILRIKIFEKKSFNDFDRVFNFLVKMIFLLTKRNQNEYKSDLSKGKMGK